MSKKAKYRGVGTLMILLFCTFSLEAQRINFSAYAGEDIRIKSVGPSELNFNSKKRIVITGSGDKVTIKRGDGGDDALAIVYEIEAAEGFDLQIDISAPPLRILENANPENEIPLSLFIAYENKGTGNLVNAIDAPEGMNSLIIPVISRISGAPGPPPDPFSGTTTSRTTGKVYLFIYGEAGPVGNVQAGLYEADISINVNYAGGSYE